jgi:hypothetical protein
MYFRNVGLDPNYIVTFLRTSNPNLITFTVDAVSCHSTNHHKHLLQHYFFFILSTK